MAKTPDFEKITDSITQADIDHFLRVAGPKDFKEEVHAAEDQRTRMRFVAGYLIRTRQLTPERLAGKQVAVGAKVTKTKARKAAAVVEVHEEA